MNYRKRCYESFITTHWNYAHSLSKEEFQLYAKVSKKRFKDILPADKNAKIIDIACGAGHFLYFLQKQGYVNTQGIDLSLEQIENAKKVGVKNLQKADLFEHLPKYKESFDMVIANDIIEHLTKDEVLIFLDLIYSSLLSGGLVLISTPNEQSLFGSAIRYCDFTHEQGFTPGSLSQVMRVCGFKGVSVYGEKPVAHDLRSTVRAGLWWCITNLLKFYSIIERGTGRNLWKRENIFEPRMFAVGRR